MWFRAFFWGAIFLFLPFHVYSEKSFSSPFPLRIAVPSVKMYVDTKQDLSIRELRQEYVYILGFLKEAVTEYKRNILTFLKEDSLTQRHPALVDNKLVFIEEEIIVDKWEDTTRQYIQIADINAGVEIINLGGVFDTYNQFIDHWFSITGEILDIKYDVNQEANELATIVNEYNNPGFYFFDMSETESDGE